MTATITLTISSNGNQKAPNGASPQRGQHWQPPEARQRGAVPKSDCTNCDGTGTATYVYGPPGTDRHTPASEIVWEEPTYRECGACKGSGSRRQRPPARTGTVYFTIDGDVDHERTTNEAHAKSKAEGNQGWTTRKQSRR